MNKSQEKTSPIEKEKLKKRLQKLFQKQEGVSTKSDSGGNSKIKFEHNTKFAASVSQKKISETQQAHTANKSNKKHDLQQEKKNVKNPAANGSFKFNFKNVKTQEVSNSSSNSKQQDKQQTNGNYTLNIEPQQNGLSNTATVKTNSKNAKKSKNFKQENRTTQKTNSLAQKSKTQESPKIQYKAETVTKSKSQISNGGPSKTNPQKNQIRKRKTAAETSKQQLATNKKRKLNNKKDKLLNYNSSSDEDNVYDNKHITDDNEDSDSSENFGGKIKLLEHKLPYRDSEEEDNDSDDNEEELLNYNSSLDEVNEYGNQNISGLVRGGDYDGSESNEMEEEYWLNQYSDNEDSDSSENFGGKIELLEHKIPYSDSEEEEEEEEQEQRYSDFDEYDYEEEEDSYDYSMDSEDEYSSDYYDHDTTYNFDDEHDDDYNLPSHVPEDLIIHRGTAAKRDIKPEDNVSFNSDHEEAQIVELQEQETVKIIEQPKAYDKEELIKLKYSEKTTTELTFLQNNTETSFLKATANTDDIKECPKLVPIVDKDGFQLYNPNEKEEDEFQKDTDIEEEDYEDESEPIDENEDDDNMDSVSLGSEYMELNSDDAESLLSEDINDKYLNPVDDLSESADEIDENVWVKKHKVDIIDATHCKYINETEKNITEESEESLSDNIKELPSVKLYRNVDPKTSSSILTATIIDNTVQESTLKSLETNDEDLSNTEFSLPMEESFNNENNNQSVVENSTLEISQTNRVKPAKAQNLINYNTKFYNAFDTNLVIVLLKDPFYVYGTVRLTLLAGQVEVYGHTLKVGKEVEIFSPRGCSIIEIAPTPKNNISKLDLKDKLKNYENHFALADLRTIYDLYDCEHDAVILLKRNETRKKIVQQFKKFMNENVFPNINNINVERPLYNTEYLLRCMINTSNQEQKCLRISQQWRQLQITSKSRVMVTGGKSVGKSTLIRYLINRHLPQQILLIDLDIGQPELFIPQTVSCTIVKQPLLGPGFMLNLEPDVSFAVGHTNVALCAHKYVEAVRNLIAHCMKEEKYQELPWLINTMGYNKGFGLELISVIVKEFTNLTDLIQLQSAKEINNFDEVLFPHVVKNVPRNMFVMEECSESNNKLVDFKDYRLHVWQSAVQQETRYLKEWEMSAKDLRFAILLTRLSQALQGHAEWLTDCKPLSASLDELKIVNLMDNTPLATSEELAKAIEANLVYLCQYQEDSMPLKCFGIGVIRAIDFHVRQVYLLPAAPHSLLKNVNCLALGEMCLPTSIFTNQGPRIKNTAAFVYNTIEANASKAIKQIYHRPRRFLTGKHKSLD